MPFSELFRIYVYIFVEKRIGFTWLNRNWPGRLFRGSGRPGAKYPLNADFCLNWMRKGRDGCESCDTPEHVCWSRRKKKKKRERPISGGFREVNRSGPVIKEKIPAPFVCGPAAGRQQLVETTFFHEPDHRNPFIVRNSPFVENETFLLAEARRRWNGRNTHSSRPPYAASSCVAARSCLFIGFTRQYRDREEKYINRGRATVKSFARRRENLGFGFGFGFGFYGLTSTPRPPRRNLEIPCILVFFFSFTSCGGFFKWISLRNRWVWESRKKRKEKGERGKGSRKVG